MSRAYVIEGLRRDSAGAVTHVGWCRRELPWVAAEVRVADVIAALRGGDQVNVMVGFIIGEGVQLSSDGTTIIDLVVDHPKALRLEDVPTM